ncbi:hydrogenase expression/formation protein [Ectothiorhodospiraceae bacterium BW-2]|nr:hydrogenase expression/formation protein [Ectothiorhodospiraceae bacterium BW-2]
MNALLAELEQMLQQLLERGESSYLTLSELSLSAAARAKLRQALGTDAPVRIEADLEQKVRIIACEIPAIWWVVHYDERDNRTDEFIEVNFFPDIATADEEQIESSIAILRAELFARSRRYR